MEIKYYEKVNNRGVLTTYAEFNGVTFRIKSMCYSCYYYIACKNDKGYKSLHQAMYIYHNPDEQLNGCDIHHIDFNPLNNDIYNLQKLTHGEHKALHNHNLSEYHRKRIVETNKLRVGNKHQNFGKINSAESNRKTSEGLKGKPKSEEHKKNLSEAKKTKLTDEQIKQIIDYKFQGVTIYRIVKLIGISRFIIERVLKENFLK